jgi:predicted dehydrogenase
MTQRGGPVYKVGIIGCGRIASEFEDETWRQHPCTHAGTYSATPQTKMVSASDINKAKLEKFSKKWGVNRLYTDYREMLSREELDIVSVCTHVETHCQITVDAARSGVKAIFCEKPMATSIPEAKKMVKVCEKYGAHLTVNHTRRWDMNYLQVRKMLLKKELGEIEKINGRYTSGLFVIGTHMIDLLSYFCGDVVKVVGVEEDTTSVDSLWYSENYSPADPPVSGVLWFKNGAIGHLLATCKTQYPLFDIDIFTAGGQIFTREEDSIKYLIEAYKFKDGKAPGMHLIKKATSRRNNLMISAVKDVVSSLRENRPTISTGKDALQTTMVLDALSKSSKSNKPVKVGG